jgi:hypothetical protein
VKNDVDPLNEVLDLYRETGRLMVELAGPEVDGLLPDLRKEMFTYMRSQSINNRFLWTKERGVKVMRAPGNVYYPEWTGEVERALVVWRERIERVRMTVRLQREEKRIRVGVNDPMPIVLTYKKQFDEKSDPRVGMTRKEWSFFSELKRYLLKEMVGDGVTVGGQKVVVKLAPGWGISCKPYSGDVTKEIIEKIDKWEAGLWEEPSEEEDESEGCFDRKPLIGLESYWIQHPDNKSKEKAEARMIDGFDPMWSVDCCLRRLDLLSKKLSGGSELRRAEAQEEILDYMAKEADGGLICMGATLYNVHLGTTLRPRHDPIGTIQEQVERWQALACELEREVIALREAEFNRE